MPAQNNRFTSQPVDKKLVDTQRLLYKACTTQSSPEYIIYRSFYVRTRLSSIMYLKEWAISVSELHGIKHIFLSGSLLRTALWVTTCLGSFVVFAYQSQVILRNYLERHHTTKLDILTAPLDLPAVTVCNFNKYRESAFTIKDIRNVGYHLGIVDEDHNLVYPHLYTDEFVQKLEAVDWDEVEEDEDFNMTDFTIRTGHQLEDLVQSCKWKEEECRPDDFVLSLTHLGACYTFNKYIDGQGFTSHNATIAGAANGLQLILDIEEIEYTPTSDLDAGAMDAGVKIMLHRPTEPPYVKELGFAVAPGLHTFVQMRHEKITSEPYPYTECEEDGDIQYYDHYSLQACRIECETRIVEKYCRCKLPEQPGDFRVCNPAETHDCAHMKLVEAIEGLLPGDECVCNSPCDVENYPSTLSTSRLRAGFIKRLFQDTHNMTEEYIRQNIAVVTIYYEALNYEEIDQIPEMTVTTLLAIMGGNMGLFLGGSFLTVVQILEYCFDEAVGCCKSQREEEKKRPSSPLVVVAAATAAISGNSSGGKGGLESPWTFDNGGASDNM